MNPFPSYDNPHQDQSFPTNNQFQPPQPYQMNSTTFYYQNGFHSYSNSAPSFNTSSMYNNNSGFQAQVHQELTTFIPPSPRKNYTGLDPNRFHQSFERALSTIQTKNQLCKQDYLKFLRQRATVQDKLQEINKINNFKLKIESFETLSQMKPTLQEARLLCDRIHQANDQTEFPEIDLIAQDIEACEAVIKKTHDFLAKYNPKVKNYSDTNPHHAIEVGPITRGFNELMKEINKLVLKDVEILYERNIFEWYLMVKLELMKEPGSMRLCDIEHWNELKKFVSTSEMLGSKQFEKVCQQINAYELIKEITEELQKQENLILQNKDNKEEMIEIRKRLMKKTEVEALLKEIQGCYVRVTKEKAYVEDLLERTRTVTNLFIQRKSKQKKLSQAQLNQFLRLFERLPMQTQEEDEINGEKLKAENIIMSVENNMALLKPYINLEFAKTIHEQYQNCFIEIPSAWWISDFYLKNQQSFSMPAEISVSAQQKDSSSSLLGKRKEPHESHEYKRSRLSTTSKSEGEVSDYSSDESTPKETPIARRNKKRNALFEPKKKLKNQVNSTASESKIEVSDFRREKAKTEIFKAILSIRDLPKNKDPVLIARRLEENVYNRYLNHRDNFVKCVASICKFLGDLNYSKKTQEKLFETTMEFEHINEYLGQRLEQDDAKPLITFDNEQRMIINTGKIQTGPMQIENPVVVENNQLIDQMANYPSYLSVPAPPATSYSKHQEEMLKKMSGLERQVSKEGGSEEGEKVDRATREKTREEFEELVRKLEGYEVLKDVKEAAKELERKVYARYFLDKRNYEKRARSIRDFLVELRDYPCLKGKVLRQGLEYGEIRNYLDTALEVFDTEAYEEERKQSRNLEFDMSLELEKLFALKEKSMGSGELPVWTPPVDFKLPDISGLTMPDDKVMIMGLERKTQEYVRIELEDENKENSRNSANCKTIELQRREELHTTTVKRPPQLIRRIFFGKVSQKISKSFSDRQACSFDTYASHDQINQFPRLLNNLPYFNKVPAGPFLQNINNFVHKNKSSFQKVLVGWITAPSFTSGLYTSISKYLIEKRYVGKYFYLPGAEIYMVPSELIDKGLKETLNWVCLDPEEAPAPDKQLLFAICLTNKYKSRLHTAMMKVISTFPGKSSYGPLERNRADLEPSLKVPELVVDGKSGMKIIKGQETTDEVSECRKKQLDLIVQSRNEGV